MQIIEKQIRGLCKYNRVVIYGVSDTATRLFYFAKAADIEIDYFVVDGAVEGQSFLGKPVREVYDLYYEVEKPFVIVGVASQKKALVMIEKLEKIGYGGNYTTICGFPMADLNTFDNMLGVTIKGDIPGYIRYGNDEPNDVIAVYGGSTSEDQLSGFDAWPKMMWRDNRKTITVYNGGVRGYSSRQEMLKCVRDILGIHPQKVICLSGYNDSYIYSATHADVKTHVLKPEDYINEVLGYCKRISKQGDSLELSQGMEERLEPANDWVVHMRVMKAVCDELGIEFYAFLQPVSFVGDYQLSSFEKRLQDLTYGDKHIHYSRTYYYKLKEMIQGISYIYDMTTLFDGANDMYIDLVHYSETGNKLIASEISKTIGLD